MNRQLLFIPGPVTCAEPVLAATARPLIDHRGPEFAALLARLERGMQPIFGTASDVVFLGSSGSGGLEAAVASSFSPGQRVLVCPIGVFGKRLASIAKTYGLDVETLETPYGHALDPAVLAQRLRTATRPFDGILLTHNETSTGAQNDMAALSRAIDGYPALVVVDSVSGLGASDFRMDEWGFDIVVTASQKALAAPPGLAMVAVSARGWERIAGAKTPRFYLDLAKAREFAKNGQTPWTPPVSLAFALDVALERFVEEGAQNVWARHAAYARAIRAAADALGLESFSQSDAHSLTVVALNVPQGVAADALRRSLRENYSIVIGGGQAELKGKIVRIGTMGALGRNDILGMLGSLELALAEQGYPVRAGAGVSAALETFLESDRAPAPALAL